MTDFESLRHPAVVLPLAALLMLATFAVEARGAADALDPARVKAVAAMLPEKPAGSGRPISDREAWARRAAEPAFKALVARAEEILSEPLPEQPDDLYLEYSRNGNRSHYQNVAFARRGRLTPLVIAECIEHKGRFIPRIVEFIDALAMERTWVLPAHDGGLANFNGKAIEIDLFSSAVGWHLATTDWLLGDQLPPAARAKLRDNVRRRILDPYRAAITGSRPVIGWMKTTNNWNAVCLAGVTGAGLVELESREDRALFVVAAETYSRNFLAGFTPDGYCSEGLGYWNYGFGHFVMLAETVRQATGGRVDLLGLPEAKPPALFGTRIQIVSGVAPAFADCSVSAKPAPETVWFVNRRLGLGLAGYDTLDLRSVVGSVSEAMLYAFPNAASMAPPSGPAALGSGEAGRTAGSGGATGPVLRDWFDTAGILVCRPAPGSACLMGAALKGGHNAEHHNHNDVGSYVVVVGDRPVLLDPGAETYTARTFSAKRYESKLLNSFGHPVPVIAGQLQKEGRKSEAKILRADFTDAADTLVMDIRSPYAAVADLVKLERTFVYSRQGAGGLTVTDRVEFKSPQTFGTAVLTLGSWKPLDARTFQVTDGKSSVRVEIDTGGAEFKIQDEPIIENAPCKPTRIGINLTKPVAAATVTLKITPVKP